MAQLFPGQDLVYILMSVPMDEASLEAYVDFLVGGASVCSLVSRAESWASSRGSCGLFSL